MSHLDQYDTFGPSDGSRSGVTPPRVHSMAQQWPVNVVLGASAMGALAAVFRSTRGSALTYVVLLVVGCGLLFYRRYDAIRATRNAGGAGALSVQGVEKFAIAALALACLLNGVVIAFEVATWAVWSDLRGQ